MKFIAVFAAVAIIATIIAAFLQVPVAEGLEVRAGAIGAATSVRPGSELVLERSEPEGLRGATLRDADDWLRGQDFLMPSEALGESEGYISRSELYSDAESFALIHFDRERYLATKLSWPHLPGSSTSEAVKALMEDGPVDPRSLGAALAEAEAYNQFISDAGNAVCDLMEYYARDYARNGMMELPMGAPNPEMVRDPVPEYWSYTRIAAFGKTYIMDFRSSDYPALVEAMKSVDDLVAERHRAVVLVLEH